MIDDNNYFRFLIEILVVLFVFLSVSAHAYDFQDCSGCHDTSLENDAKQSYLHAPFLDKLCDECHAAEAVNDYSLKKEKIDWISDSVTVDNTHAFRFPDRDLGDTLIVEITGEPGQAARHEIVVPSLKNLKEIQDAGISPSISNVKLISLNQGIFLTATVGWETDIWTDAVALYGEKDISQKSDAVKRLGRQHQVVLRNLAENKIYSFIAISNDLFGRRKESEPVAFSTSIPSSIDQPKQIDSPQDEGTKEEITANFQRLGDDYFIVVTLARAAHIFLGTKGEKTSCLPDDEFHSGLSCVEVSSMDACLNCHDRHDHPLNVAPEKKGTIIPNEYPTFPGGRIICTSCHKPHSSKYSHLTRRDSAKELCTSCHRNWGK